MNGDQAPRTVSVTRFSWPRRCRFLPGFDFGLGLYAKTISAIASSALGTFSGKFFRFGEQCTIYPIT